MEIGSRTVLVTGGASGIGLALAVRLLRAGSRVIVCGRREDKLRQAAAAHPSLVTRPCDLSKDSERRALAADLPRAYPELDVLVNNAGIQRRVRLAEDEP